MYTQSLNFVNAGVYRVCVRGGRRREREARLREKYISYIFFFFFLVFVFLESIANARVVKYKNGFFFFFYAFCRRFPLALPPPQPGTATVKPTTRFIEYLSHPARTGNASSSSCCFIARKTNATSCTG